VQLRREATPEKMALEPATLFGFEVQELDDEEEIRRVA